MKNVLTLFVAFFVLAFAVSAQTASNPSPVKFKEEVHNFGKVPQGTPVAYEFAFTNSTKSPIIIENVQSSCGCTIPSWTKSPILPGQKGTVSAQYNAASMGNFNKPVTVYYKIGEEKHEVKLYLAGEVVNKDDLNGAPAKSDNILKDSK